MHLLKPAQGQEPSPGLESAPAAFPRFRHRWAGIAAAAAVVRILAAVLILTALWAPPLKAQRMEPAAREIYEELRREALRRPEAAFARASELRHPLLRDRILRDAWATALRDDPETAARRLPELLDRPWVADAGFHAALELALQVIPSSLEQARGLLVAAARRHPGVALRQMDRYVHLPRWGAAILDEAALAAPGEAAVLASGRSAWAARLRTMLAGSLVPSVKALAELAEARNVSESVRRRAAFLLQDGAAGGRTLEAALGDAADDARYFTALAGLRRNATGTAADALDGELEHTAQTWMRALAQGGRDVMAAIARLSLRDVYLLLAYGRAEEDQRSFTLVFDRVLAPKARASGGNRNLVAAMGEAGNARLAVLLEAAVQFQRLQPLLELVGGGQQRSGFLRRAVRQVAEAREPLEAALRVALLMDALPDAALRRQLGESLRAVWEEQIANGAKDGLPTPGAHRQQFVETLLALLAARLAGAPGEIEAWLGKDLARLAAAHRTCFRTPQRLEVRELFPGGRCVQRYFFYNDDDGVTSYRSFLSVYSKERAWTVTDHGGFVCLTGRGMGGRVIEIYANTPVDIEGARSAAEREEGIGRQESLTRYLAARRIQPVVVVHRGHSYHLDATLAYLNRAVRLVYVGSCHGIEKIETVIDRANTSQVIATRATGSHLVNDPLLKALNDAFLHGVETIDWRDFWLSQRTRLQGNGHFAGYVPPHENTVAMFLNAWQNCLLEP